MANTVGSFALVLHTHIPYVLDHGRWPHGTDWLFEAAAECYVPLLDTLTQLVEEGVSPKITIGLTPILVEQLADADFKHGFEGYLQERMHAAEENAASFRQEMRPELESLAGYWREYYSGVFHRFLEVYNRDIVAAFRNLQDAGHIEILTSAATHGYLPLLGTDASVSAQVKQGVECYRHHFGRKPRGFWLPECAYRPAYHWQPPVEKYQTSEPTLRKGVEEILAAHSLKYFFVDRHLLLGGKAIGVYAERFRALEVLWSQFEKEYKPVDEERSPYEAYVVNSSGKPLAPVGVFARDHETGIQVWSGETGYPGDEWYLEFHKKHFPGNLRYWRVSWPRDDLATKQVYEPVRALSRLPEQASHFAGVVHKVLAKHKRDAGHEGIVTSAYDTELFGHWWFEGAKWLYYAIRRLAEDGSINRVTCSEYLEANPPSEVVSLPEGSWGEGGYHWIWLNEWTSWTWDKIYECESEMSALAALYKDASASAPLLKQAAKELLLLESSDWQFNISTWSARDYAEQRFKAHYTAFKSMAALARKTASGEELDPDEISLFAECKERDRCFREIDPRWWIP